MPYKDPIINKIKAAERCRRYRARQHAERFGDGAGDMRGKHGNHSRGSKNGRWNDDRIVSSHGYVKVRVGKEHPLADPNGYAYEHLLVWVSAGNNLPGRKEVIHHRDENKTNNRLGNLEMVSRSHHPALHPKTRDERGRFVGNEWPEDLKIRQTPGKE